jgi:hypothetical protein
MSMRGVALVAGWVLGLGLATAISWTAVGRVGDEVASTGSGLLTQAEVERRIHTIDEASAPSPVAPEPASRPTRPVASSQTSVVARGGSVVFRCRGSSITANYSPAPGYSGQQATDLDGEYIEVGFRNRTRRSTVEGYCEGGIPVTDVDESEDSGDTDDG